MFSLILNKKKQPTTDNHQENDEEEQDECPSNNCDLNVSRHLHLKPPHSTGTLDKAVVVRRIRRRRHANKVKSAVESLFSSPFTSKLNNSCDGDDCDGKKKQNGSVGRIKWADDAFAAP